MDISFTMTTRAKKRRRSRLSGGAGPTKDMSKTDLDNDDVDVDIDDVDDAEPDVDDRPPPAIKKLRLVEPKVQHEPDRASEAEPPPSVFEIILYYIKMGFLVFVWFVMMVLLALMPIEKGHARLITVQPNEFKDVPVHKSSAHLDKITVLIFGPFKSGSQPSQHLFEGKSNLIVMFQCVKYDSSGNEQSTEDISSKQYFHLEDTKDYDHTTPTSIQGQFYIDNPKEKSAKATIRIRFSVAASDAVTVKFYFERGTDYQTGIILGALVLVLLYVAIVWELINRTLISVIAATLALSILSFMRSRPTLSKVISWIDSETLMLLFGMMILVGILSDSGIFDYFAVYAYKISKGHVWPMVNSLCFFTASLSAFLDSVTMMLLITPIIIKLCEVMHVDPVLVLMFLVIYANVGAACTPVGDPPNIIITTNEFVASNNVNFGTFMLHCVPCVLLALLQTYIQIRCTFRKLGTQPYDNRQDELRRVEHAWRRASVSLAPYSKGTLMIRRVLMRRAHRLKRKLFGRNKPPTENYEETLSQLRSSYGIRNKTLLIKSLIAFSFSISLFFLHSIHDLHHLTLGWAALMGAVLLLIIADVKDMESILSRVEWSTLIFFASLFILMEALSEIGLIAELGRIVEDVVKSVDESNRLTVAILLLLWVSSIASAFLDNIPVTTMMIRIVISLAQNKELKIPMQPLVWALALGACFGGNGTLIGASANVVSAGVAEQHGYQFTFKRFFYVGFPLMIGNVIVTSIYLIICHVVCDWHDPPLE